MSCLSKLIVRISQIATFNQREPGSATPLPPHTHVAGSMENWTIGPTAPTPSTLKDGLKGRSANLPLKFKVWGDLVLCGVYVPTLGF